MDILGHSAEWLEQQRLRTLAVPVTYERRSGRQIPVNATLGRTLFRAENEYGITVRIESRDFLISASELTDEPERGDVVIYNGRRYEVLAPNGEPVWRWSEPYQRTRRIHTKDVCEEEE